MNRNITTVILIVLAVGVYLTYTSPQWKKVQAVRTVNAEYAKAINNAEELIKTRDGVLAKYNSLSPVDKDRLNKMLPTAVDNVRLIIDLNNIAQRRGMTLEDIQTETRDSSADVNLNIGLATASQPNIANPILDTVKITFKVTGAYQQFVDFIKDVESSLRIIDLANLKLTTGDSANTYTYNVTMTTYWLNE